MRTRWTWASVLFAALLGVAGGNEGETPRITGVRYGHHSTYDRIVVELSGQSHAVYVPTAEKIETLIEVAARPPRTLTPLPAGLRRIQTLEIRAIQGGTRIQVIGTGGPVRTFLLANPVRLIIDLADRDHGQLPMPGDVDVLPFDVAGLRSLAPEPAPAPEPEDVSEPVTPPEPASVPGPASEPEVEPEPPPEAVAEPELTPEPAPEAEPEMAKAEPVLDLPPILEELPPLPPPIVRIPEPTDPGYDRWLALAIWVGGPILLLALGFSFLRGRRPGPEPVDVVRTPESITGGEILASSDRLDLLEKRIDEEVRSRMNLERRVVEVQENLKVVRDRVTRLSRRGEEGG